MKKYKLYLFDLDGTLFDSDQMLVETFHYLYKKYKPSYFVIDEDKIITFSGPQIKDTLLQEFPELNQDELLIEWRRESVKNYPLYTKLFPGAYEVLRDLTKMNIPCAIVTNKHRSAADKAFAIFGVDKLGVYSVCGDECIGKPNPDGIYKAMEHFKIKNKNDVIYIGDSKFDEATASNAGVDFGLVEWSPRKLPENAKISVKIRSFSEITGAFE